jgi:SSS family solute:Na+ symporter
VLHLHLSALDWGLLASYFAVVLAIGIAARRSIATSEDFLLSGRALPAWITGLAFISANLGATEILGMSANGAQYGTVTVHYYWIGAVPAMVLLGVVMMPFYYHSKARSVPEYLRLRYNDSTHVLNSLIFAVAAVLIAGVNLYALAVVLQALIGLSIYGGVVISAAIVLAYILLGGLSGAIYNEVLQFFVILAGLIPLVVLSVKKVGGFAKLGADIVHSKLGDNGLHAWRGTGVGHIHQAISANWIEIVFGLGFVLSFGYWTSNFTEVQRAFSARNLSAARRTPLIAAYPKMLIPALTVLPGLVALAIVPDLGSGSLTYNDAIPALMQRLLPSGVLGIAVTGLFASFMAGVAANVSSLNTVVTYDLVQAYARKGKDDAYYLRCGRVVTVAGVVLGIGAAMLANQFNNLMNYLQDLFSIFNAPIFATFVLGMFWRRTTAWGGFWGLLSGVIAGATTFVLYEVHVLHFGSDLAASFVQAGVAFCLDALVTVMVSLLTEAPAAARLRGIVWGSTGDAPDDELPEDRAWYRRPWLLGGGALAAVIALDFLFA